jgi:tRNA threonylcarbamoyl adenosine modification protein (Sua5/YciO/YrdC/YwlC family)
MFAFAEKMLYLCKPKNIKMMLLKVYADKPNVKPIVDVLEQGGVIIYPTDTLYAFACDINNVKAARRLASLKGKVLEKSNFSIVCSSLSQISQYAKPLSNEQFRILKQNLPGAFTFVLKTSSRTPKIFQTKKQTIGVRIPANEICLAIVEEFGRPILTSSLPMENDEEECYANIELVYEKYGNVVEMIIDAGKISNVPSCVVDLTQDDPENIREGGGLPRY